jgi:hypothetical protein
VLDPLDKIAILAIAHWELVFQVGIHFQSGAKDHLLKLQLQDEQLCHVYVHLQQLRHLLLFLQEIGLQFSKRYRIC